MQSFISKSYLKFIIASKVLKIQRHKKKKRKSISHNTMTNASIDEMLQSIKKTVLQLFCVLRRSFSCWGTDTLDRRYQPEQVISLCFASRCPKSVNKRHEQLFRDPFPLCAIGWFSTQAMSPRCCWIFTGSFYRWPACKSSFAYTCIQQI